MTKSKIYTLLMLAAPLMLAGINITASPLSKQQALTQQVNKQITQAEENQQLALFVKQLVQRNPAQAARLLVQPEQAYIYDDTVVYIGVKANGEVLVVCYIPETGADAQWGSFYHVIHKEGTHITTSDQAAMPATEGFATMFRVVKNERWIPLK